MRTFIPRNFTGTYEVIRNIPYCTLGKPSEQAPGLGPLRLKKYNVRNPWILIGLVSNNWNDRY